METEPAYIPVVSAHSRATCQQNVTSGTEAEDPPHTHNMLVVGKKSAFTSHLPMFSALNTAKTDYTSPHRYQLILEVRFIREGKDVTDIYTKDRQSNGETKKCRPSAGAGVCPFKIVHAGYSES